MGQRKWVGVVAIVVLGGLLLLASILSTRAADGQPIRLLYATFDPVQDGEPAVPPELQADPDSPYSLLQLVGPIQQDWIDELQAAGVVFYGFVPDYTYIVSLPPASRESVVAHSAVRWLGPVHPAYKLSPGVTGGQLLLEIYPDADVAAVAAAIVAAGAAILEQNDSGHLFVVTAGEPLLPLLAGIDEVRWLQNTGPLPELNDDARWLSQSAMLDQPTLHDHGLTGAGQVGAVADQGLAVYDYGTANPLLYNAVPSCYFVDDGNNGNGGVTRLPGPTHRKVVDYVVPPGSGGDFLDATGHGSHVVGSVVGDRAPWSAPSPADGQAYAARIFFQDIGRGVGFPEDPLAGEIVPPSDYRVLFGQAYDPNGDGVYQPAQEPRTHSNSWGSPQPIYSAESGHTDDFMWAHPDFLILYAAGNQGPAPNTIGYPATAKNIVTVGATENGYANPNNVLFFSSHGPAPIGRLKPTVVGPGDRITSALRGDPCATEDRNGTSMATPTLHGISLLVRQYLWDGYYPHGAADPAHRIHPSAALLKAMLINSGRPIAGAHSDNASGGSWPSHGQGWGRVTAEDVLYFPGDRRTLWLHDEYALDGSAGFGAAGQTRSFTINVGNGRPFAAEPLKIVLAWTDYPGEAIAGGALVNDLNLTVTGPNGAVYVGNDTAGNDFIGMPDLPLTIPDSVNPWEVVYLAEPAPGAYTITVSAAGLGSLALDSRGQGFALVVTGDVLNSQGRAQIEYPVYDVRPAAVARLRISDLDLNANPAAVETVPATVSSTTSSTGFTVTLTETGANSSVFSGQVTLATSPAAPGELLVAEGDTIRLSYDAGNDDGTAYDTATIGPLPLNLINPPWLNTPDNTDGDDGYSLTWSAPEETADLAGYVVQESVDYTISLRDDAEGALADNWTTGGLQPWQQDTQFKQSGLFSYWSGRGDVLFDLDTSLTLNHDVVIPAGVAEAHLTFYSRYYNDFNDFGHVEISANGGPWLALRRLYADPRLVPANARLQYHQFDLSEYAGTPIRIRFRYNNGIASQAPDSPGWWVDDIRISGGAWQTIATTSPGVTGYAVTGQATGRYFYRVQALYDDGASAWSNVEDITVDVAPTATPTATPTPSPTPIPTETAMPASTATGTPAATAWPPPAPSGGGHVTGGGWLADSDGHKLNFGFQVNAKKESEGELQLRDRAAGVKIDVVEVTAVGHVVEPCGDIFAGSKALEFRGSGTFNGAAAVFRVCVEDNAEPGNSGATSTPDRFYLACLSGCAYDTSTRTPDDAIDGGNIRVHKLAQGNGKGAMASKQDKAPAAANVSVLILRPVLLSEGIIGAAQVLEAAAYGANGKRLSGAAVTLEGIAADGTAKILTSTTGTNGLAIFAITILPGEVEYIAYSNSLSSNAVNLNGIAP